MVDIEDYKKINCHHCNWTWNYKGKRENYTICPNCRFNVNLRKRLVSNLENGKQ